MRAVDYIDSVGPILGAITDLRKVAEAAKLLVALEWSKSGLEGHMQCPICDAYDPACVVEGDRLYYFNRSGHEPDTCELAALVAAVKALDGASPGVV